MDIICHYPAHSISARAEKTVRTDWAGQFFSSKRSNLEVDEYNRILQELTDAVAVLSRNKIGALIVLTRETGIGEHTESGIELMP